MKPWHPDEMPSAYIARLEARVKQLEDERVSMARRIHNQRVALRENWQTIEMRAQYKRAWYPSKLLSAILNRRNSK